MLGVAKVAAGNWPAPTLRPHNAHEFSSLTVWDAKLDSRTSRAATSAPGRFPRTPKRRNYSRRPTWRQFRTPIPLGRNRRGHVRNHSRVDSVTGVTDVRIVRRGVCVVGRLVAIMRGWPDGIS